MFVPVSASTDSVSAVGAASSSVMVPVASASLIMPPTGSVNSTRKVSSPSCKVSSVVATVKVWLLAPLAKSSFVAAVIAV